MSNLTWSATMKISPFGRPGSWWCGRCGATYTSMFPPPRSCSIGWGWRAPCAGEWQLLQRPIPPAVDTDKETE